MKKNYLLLTLLFFTCTLAFAGNVTIDKARQVALNFFSEKSHNGNEALRILDSHTQSFNGAPVFYVFNFSGNGFVIVSADDDVIPVLGYSFEGTCSNDNHPPQFTSWMEGYVRQIDWARTSHYTAGEKVKSEWDYYLAPGKDRVPQHDNPSSVDPLLISTWDQGAFYNSLCPSNAGGPNGHVWAGCVATAMSQVMFYYRWPLTGMGSHCYTPSGYPQQCADFGNTTYDWNSMLNSLSGQDTAVATLIWHCGVSVNMMYSPTGSGAYSEDAVTAFINNFKYHPNTVLLYKDNYPEEQWDSILRDNLNHRRPMYYDGYGTGGHAFVLDGYQDENYFHFNWGWSGSCNGYYYLNNLNPGGDNFTYGQGAIVNLFPDTLQYSYPGTCPVRTEISSLTGTLTDASWPLPYQNNSSCSWLLQPSGVSDSVTSLTINFNRFNTEAGQDIVNIYQGTTTNDTLVGSFSGNNLPPSVNINGNKALVTFTTNGNTNGPGWYATFTAHSLSWCNHITTFTAPNDSISDGSLYFNYKNNTNCRWIINPENSGSVMFTFTKLNTEPQNDIVTILDFGTHEVLGQFSGDYSPSSLPDPVLASSGKMMVLFTTNGSRTDQGWAGYYTSFPLGVSDLQGIANIKIYPNPAHDRVTVKMYSKNAQKLKAEVLSLDGKMLFNDSWSAEAGTVEKELDITGFRPGVYVLKITGDQSAVTQKLVVD